MASGGSDSVDSRAMKNPSRLLGPPGTPGAGNSWTMEKVLNDSNCLSNERRTLRKRQRYSTLTQQMLPYHPNPSGGGDASSWMSLASDESRGPRRPLAGENYRMSPGQEEAYDAPC
eukprot:756552-Hanusia_phi.AAC.1